MFVSNFIFFDFPGGSDSKVYANNAGDLGPMEGNGTPLQYSCLKNPVDGGVC